MFFLESLPTLLGGASPSSKSAVDPSRWCITRDDLDYLEREVRAALAKGDIPQQDDSHLPTPGHHDLAIGPSIYQVNEHYIKPVTKASGSMSWALMRNPGGLQCDFFVTHSWNEGIFELISKVRSAWPAGADHVYLSFLAHPQQEDTAAIYDLSQGPLTVAMATARQMTVVPNHHEPIFGQLRCVYEAHLAIEKASKNPDFEVTLLTPDNRHLLALMTLLAVCPVLGGFLCAGAFAPSFGFVLGPLSWLLAACVACEVAEILRAPLMEHLATQQRERLSEVAAVCICYAELFVLGAAYALSHWHAALDRDHTGHYVFNFLGREFPEDLLFERGEAQACFALFFVVTLTGVHRISLELARQAARAGGSNLQFPSVIDMHRGSPEDMPEDDAKYFAVMGNQIEEVDRQIRNLLRLGRFNHSIHLNLAEGISISRLRDSTTTSRGLLCGAACVSWGFWWLTDLAGRGLGAAALMLLGVLVFSAVRVSQHFGGERRTFSLHSAYVFGLIFLLISNNHYFFSSEAVGALSMTTSTCFLQLLCLGAWLLAMHLHYKGVCVTLEGLVTTWSAGSEKSRLIQASA